MMRKETTEIKQSFLQWGREIFFSPWIFFILIHLQCYNSFTKTYLNCSVALMEKSLGTWMEAEHPREGDIYCLESFVDRYGGENCPSWYQNSQYQLLHFCPKYVGFCMPIKTKTRKISWQNTLIWSLSTGFWFHSTSKFLKLWRIERRENICLKTGLKDWEKWACFQLSLQVSFLMVPSGTRTWHVAPEMYPTTHGEVAPVSLSLQKAPGKGLSPLWSSLQEARQDVKASLPSFFSAQMQH